VNATNALDNPLEEFGNQVFNFVHFTHFKHFLQLSEEECLLDAVGKWPVLKQSLQESNSQSSILGEEEHGASQQLFIESGASLHFVEGNYNVLEEDNVFVSERDSEPRNDAGQNVEEFSCSIELVSLVDEGVEALVDCLTNHFTPRN
jgi:hypothetical protein